MEVFTPLAPDVEITYHFTEDSCVTLFNAPKGKAIIQHKHKRDHQSALLLGRAILEVDGQKFELQAPYCTNIPAHKKHSVIALTNIIWACIWDELADPKEAIEYE